MIIIVVLGYYVTMGTRTIDEDIYSEYRGITQQYRFTLSMLNICLYSCSGYHPVVHISAEGHFMV